MISLNYTTFIKDDFYFSVHFVKELFQAWDEEFIYFDHGSDVNDCWKRIIRGLTHVYMIIRMNMFITEFSSQYLGGSICDHFICIHVGLCSRTCLPNNQRKLIVPFSRNNFIRSLDNCIGYFMVESKLFIYNGCTFLQNPKSFDNWRRHQV